MNLFKDVLVVISTTSLIAGASAVIKVNVLEAKYESQKEILMEIKTELCEVKRILMTKNHNP